MHAWHAAPGREGVGANTDDETFMRGMRNDEEANWTSCSPHLCVGDRHNTLIWLVACSRSSNPEVEESVEKWKSEKGKREQWSYGPITLF